MSKKKKKEEKLEETQEIKQDDQNNLFEEQIKELEDKNLRLLAEFNNYKKRSSEEYLQAKNVGKIEGIKNVLDVFDDFERAMTQECSDGNFFKGMEMIYNKLKQKISDLGVEEIDTSDKLDPNYHQALMVENNKDLEDDVIIDVLQKGYKLENTLIRPALVKVNKK